MLARVPDMGPFTVDQAIASVTLHPATGGNTPAIKYALDGQSNDDFPPGLAFNSTTRVLSGTPTEVGVLHCLL